jgi:NAD(P)H-dependent flavin oxidoreductase YrpB (nitropropane dioxygenase family)
MLGVALPIVQAPMGWIARSQLASAVSNAGGMGIIETSSGELDAIRIEIARMRTLTDKPFGVNIAQAFVRDPGIVNFVVDQGVKFVSTSAGDPGKYCAALKQAGLTVFHVVPTLKAALRAVDAGVDGLIVEGGEGGGFKHSDPVMTMVLLPQVAEAVSVPVIAAGGISCGRTMAAAFGDGGGGCAVRDADGFGRGVASARQLEAGDFESRFHGHGVPQSFWQAGAAGVADRAQHAAGSGIRAGLCGTTGVRGVRAGAGALFRR